MKKLGIVLLLLLALSLQACSVPTAAEVQKMVVQSYSSVEERVTTEYHRIEDSCIEAFFAQEGETVEQARERLAQQK